MSSTLRVGRECERFAPMGSDCQCHGLSLLYSVDPLVSLVLWLAYRDYRFSSDDAPEQA